MAQAERITTAIRELMSRGRPLKSTSPVRAAHTEFGAALAANAPRPLHSEANSEDLEGCAEHLEKVFAALHVYLTAIIAETTQDIGQHPRSPLPRRPIPTIFGRRAGGNPRCCCRNAGARELEGLMTFPLNRYPRHADRRYFIGGSDARIIMGTDETALARLWLEKRGEEEPPDYSDNLIVQLGVATEPINRLWYEKTTGQAIKDVQSWVRHPVIRWMAATLDGVVEDSGAVFEAKFMLPWSFSEEAAAEKTWPRFSTTCGSPMPPTRCSRLLPAAANGWRSR
jgi:hypothetical protein